MSVGQTLLGSELGNDEWDTDPEFNNHDYHHSHYNNSWYFLSNPYVLKLKALHDNSDQRESVVRERSFKVRNSGSGAVTGEDGYQMVHGNAMHCDKMETTQMHTDKMRTTQIPQIRVR